MKIKKRDLKDMETLRCKVFKYYLVSRLNSRNSQIAYKIKKQVKDLVEVQKSFEIKIIDNGVTIYAIPLSEISLSKNDLVKLGFNETLIYESFI